MHYKLTSQFKTIPQSGLVKSDSAGPDVGSPAAGGRAREPLLGAL